MTLGGAVVPSGPEAVFTKAELAGRIGAARAALAARDIDVMIVTGPENIFDLPPALRIYGEFTVGVSQTAIVTESGCKTLSNIPRDLRLF